MIFETYKLFTLVPNFRAITSYSTAHTADAVYTFGGWSMSAETARIVAEYKGDQWRRLPDLKIGRWFQVSMRIGQEVLIFGGRASTTE